MHRRCCLLAASSVHYTASCKHSLVLLRMGEIIARNMLSWLKLLIKSLLLHPVGCLYYCINDVRTHKHQTSKDSWTEFWIKQIELAVQIQVHKTTNKWNQFLFSWLDSPPAGQGLLSIEDSRSHSHTPHSVGILWNSDQPDAETSTWQHTTLTRETDICTPVEIRTRNPTKRSVADPCLRRRDHWDRLKPYLPFEK